MGDACDGDPRGGDARGGWDSRGAIAHAFVCESDGAHRRRRRHRDIHRLIGTSAEVDETALAVAAACGAIELTDEFCLEGRCGSCSMRRNDEDDVLLGCRTLVGENDPTAASVLFRIGGATGPRFDDTTTWSM